MIEFVGGPRNVEGHKTLKVRQAFVELSTIDGYRSLRKPRFLRGPRTLG